MEDETAKIRHKIMMVQRDEGQNPEKINHLENILNAKEYEMKKVNAASIVEINMLKESLIQKENILLSKDAEKHKEINELKQALSTKIMILSSTQNIVKEKEYFVIQLEELKRRENEIKLENQQLKDQMANSEIKFNQSETPLLQQIDALKEQISIRDSEYNLKIEGLQKVKDNIDSVENDIETKVNQIRAEKPYTYSDPLKQMNNKNNITNSYIEQPFSPINVDSYLVSKQPESHSMLVSKLDESRSILASRQPENHSVIQDDISQTLIKSKPYQNTHTALSISQPPSGRNNQIYEIYGTNNEMPLTMCVKSLKISPDENLLLVVSADKS